MPGLTSKNRCCSTCSTSALASCTPPGWTRLPSHELALGQSALQSKSDGHPLYKGRNGEPLSCSWIVKSNCCKSIVLTHKHFTSYFLLLAGISSNQQAPMHGALRQYVFYGYKRLMTKLPYWGPILAASECPRMHL